MSTISPIAASAVACVGEQAAPSDSRVSRFSPPRLSPDERFCAGRKFARSLHLEHIEVYWVPTIRGIIVRSVNAQRIFRLPGGTVSVGIYAQPFKTEDFLEDLEALLVKLETSLATQTANDESLIAAAGQ